jgi:hypothetical protein
MASPGDGPRLERLARAAVCVQAAFRGWASRRYTDCVNQKACAQWIEWHLRCNHFYEARELGWEGDEAAVKAQNRVRARAALTLALWLQARFRRRQAAAQLARRARQRDAEADGDVQLETLRLLLPAWPAAEIAARFAAGKLQLEPCCAAIFARALRTAAACDAMAAALRGTLDDGHSQPPPPPTQPPQQPTIGFSNRHEAPPRDGALPAGWSGAHPAHPPQPQPIDERLLALRRAASAARRLAHACSADAMRLWALLLGSARAEAASPLGACERALRFALREHVGPHGWRWFTLQASLVSRGALPDGHLACAPRVRVVVAGDGGDDSAAATTLLRTTRSPRTGPLSAASAARFSADAAERANGRSAEGATREERIGWPAAVDARRDSRTDAPAPSRTSAIGTAAVDWQRARSDVTTVLCLSAIHAAAAQLARHAQPGPRAVASAMPSSAVSTSTAPRSHKSLVLSTVDYAVEAAAVEAAAWSAAEAEEAAAGGRRGKVELTTVYSFDSSEAVKPRRAEAEEDNGAAEAVEYNNATEAVAHADAAACADTARGDAAAHADAAAHTDADAMEMRLRALYSLLDALLGALGVRTPRQPPPYSAEPTDAGASGQLPPGLRALIAARRAAAREVDQLGSWEARLAAAFQSWLLALLAGADRLRTLLGALKAGDEPGGGGHGGRQRVDVAARPSADDARLRLLATRGGWGTTSPGPERQALSLSRAQSQPKNGGSSGEEEADGRRDDDNDCGCAGTDTRAAVATIRGAAGKGGGGRRSLLALRAQHAALEAAVARAAARRRGYGARTGDGARCADAADADADAAGARSLPPPLRLQSQWSDLRHATPLALLSPRQRSADADLPLTALVRHKSEANTPLSPRPQPRLSLAAAAKRRASALRVAQGVWVSGHAASDLARLLRLLSDAHAPATAKLRALAALDSVEADPHTHALPCAGGAKPIDGEGALTAARGADAGRPRILLPPAATEAAACDTDAWVAASLQHARAVKAAMRDEFAASGRLARAADELIGALEVLDASAAGGLRALGAELHAALSQRQAQVRPLSACFSPSPSLSLSSLPSPHSLC